MPAVLSVFVALTCAAPQQRPYGAIPRTQQIGDPRLAAILRLDSEIYPDGRYHYAYLLGMLLAWAKSNANDEGLLYLITRLYETENGIAAERSCGTKASRRKLGEHRLTPKSYSTSQCLQYTADENGYHPLCVWASLSSTQQSLNAVDIVKGNVKNSRVLTHLGHERNPTEMIVYDSMILWDAILHAVEKEFSKASISSSNIFKQNDQIDYGAFIIPANVVALFCTIVAVSFAAPQYNNGLQRTSQNLDPRQAAILRFESDIFPDGRYHYAYDTENGISAEESGEQNPLGIISEPMRWEGTNTHLPRVDYTADENGYHPVGDVLPTPPPIPEAILSPKSTLTYSGLWREVEAIIYSKRHPNAYIAELRAIDNLSSLLSRWKNEVRTNRNLVASAGVYRVADMYGNGRLSPKDMVIEDEVLTK
ncbi:hypothetical protein NQ318_011113 [Aromia moschata]|uniref:Uncharacterized protein n=1 Tax=Aromia moschata TaxID=1265417 RepID=A0AAV8YSG3_9CUCU|nr:hypothetical protein NQ318_011113 [Aromia moschata]